jgi:hypothetical protein
MVAHGAPSTVSGREFSGITILDTLDVQSHTVASLGLDATILDLFSPEALSAIVRRAAVYHTPCTKRGLREVVQSYLHALTDPDIPADRIQDVIEALAGSGELLELPALDRDVPGSLLYVAPPTFVARPSGVIILLGAFPDDATPFSQALRNRIEYRGHTRRLVAVPGENLDKHLKDLGFIELPDILWLRQPQITSPEDVLRRANELLDSRARFATSEGLDDLLILDPSYPNTYYSGRWRTQAKAGRFVARREQRYGSALWSYVEFVESRPNRLLDLPQSEWRGCDDAWRLQLAIDATLGHPQVYRLRKSPPKGTLIIDFFSPLPSWAQRKWDLLGERVDRYHSLLAYRLNERDFEDERTFIRDSLWMVEDKT